MQPNELTAAQAARRIESGDLTAEALTAACLERISSRDEAVRAWAYIDRDLALKQARALDRMPRQSRLHGVPFGIKDVFDTADMPSEYNSPIWRGHRPKADASCVAQLRRAGCLILGKTVTTEFAQNNPAQTRNPLNPNHTPGGSSSGSAASVADFMVPLALGTQTGGSVIRPAAYCGTFAIKPSFGSINRAGTKFVAESLDTIGAFARSVEDLELAMEVLTSRAKAPAPSGAPRIGLCRTPLWDVADSHVQKNLEAAARRLEQAGAKVRDFDLPPGTKQIFDNYRVVGNYESARALAWEYANFPSQISKNLTPRLQEGWKITRAEYDATREVIRSCGRVLADTIRDVDLLLTPSAPSEAPASLTTTGDPVFNRAWTMLGLPCVTVPHGKGPKGLPLAVQIVGAFDSDSALLAWAHWTTNALG
jgi:Asp-tRNA(Asn)/Glu-tRNA(Gln) amidotransferase A subunit family amidase